MSQLQEDEAHRAVLGSPLDSTRFELWDPTATEDSIPEWADVAVETVLSARLEGKMCKSTTSAQIDVEELANLVSALRSLDTLQTHEVGWSTYSGVIELSLRILQDRIGPPVLCDVWLRAASGEEEHHCRFESDMTWLSAFTSGVEQIANRYGRVRTWLA